MKQTAVIVARFQTPYLHEGHQHLLRSIREKHNKMVVVLGVAPVRFTKKNPYDFHTREKMLKAFDPGLIILPLPDKRSDEEWSRSLDQLLRSGLPGESFILYGSRDSFCNSYKGVFETKELPAAGTYNASEIREQLADHVLASESFRMGINYVCQNSYSRLFPTVDIAVIDDTNKTVLMGQKSEATGWRFPGGYCDVADDRLEEAALRELSEECGDIKTGPLQYIGSFKVDDWRYRHESDKIMTTFFITNLKEGQPQAGDDLARVEWIPLDQLPSLLATQQIIPEHEPLCQRLLQFLSNNPVHFQTQLS
jgi:bifunctional NMN adenylyltransferase/nudix hydrolase